MSDDVTVRLRSQAKRSPYIEWGHEGADEIDRLRAEVESWKEKHRERVADRNRAMQDCETLIQNWIDGMARNDTAMSVIHKIHRIIGRSLSKETE